MKRAVARAAAAAALVVVGTVGSAYAQQLPRTGSIAFHTGWKFTGELKKLGPAHMQGHGTVSGVTFNDSGSGPLHLGPANCFDVFFVVDGKGRNKGYCTFSDADGDRIFTEFTGNFTFENGGEGTNNIAGGTGKYEGVTGSGPWRCKSAGEGGEVQCAQCLDYRLP